MTSFASLVSPQLVRALAGMGVHTPTAIQAQALPALLAGKSAAVTAETGCGKTLLFALPAASRAAAVGTPQQPSRPTSVLLAPSHELCRQIDRVMRGLLGAGREPALLAKGTRGGLGSGPSREGLLPVLPGAVVIGTPGLVYNHVTRGLLLPRSVGLVGVDEADMSLSGNFLHDVENLVDCMSLPTDTVKTQFIFCAIFLPHATMTNATNHRDVSAWIDAKFRTALHFTSPKLHCVSPAVAIGTVRLDLENVAEISDHLGLSFEDGLWEARAFAVTKLLHSLLQHGKLRGKTVVFVNSSHAAEALCAYIGVKLPSLRVEPFHKDVPEEKRYLHLEQFEAGLLDVLVSTDLLSRGIDTTFVSQIILGEVPSDVTAFLHRVGRTARASTNGTVTVIVTDDELPQLTMFVSRTSAALAGMHSQPARSSILPNSLSLTRSARFRSWRKKGEAQAKEQ